jgi:uncharacterized protein YbaP (TraB family)
MPFLRIRYRTPVAGRRTANRPIASRALRAAGICLLAIWVCGLPRAAADEIYRWRDAGGVLHFSDAPPLSGEAVRISPEGPAELPPAGAASSPRPSPAGAPAGVFWRIDKGLTPPSFLLGTIHSADPRVLHWPAAVDDALGQARCLILEISLDPDNFLKLGRAMMFTDDQDIADLLGPADYRRLVAAMAAQPVPETLLRKMKPWVLMALLGQPRNGSGEFMDLRLYRRAMAAGKTVIGLETIEEQLDVFDGLPLDDQVRLLRSTLDQVEDVPHLLAQMIDTYLDGDLDAIAALAASTSNKDAGDLERRLFERLNDARNNRMVERMMPRIEQGGAFIAVGALHLAGPHGIIRQLAARGCRMTPVNGR